MKLKVGIIGGSGLDNPDLLENRSEKSVKTPFGDPSDVLIEGTIKGVDCVLLARHGRKHTIQPTDVNYRANIWALKEVGCNVLVVTTACGSLRESIIPGDIMLLNDFIDRTTKRKQTFYDGTSESHKGVCHIPMNGCFSKIIRDPIESSIQELGFRYHPEGTMVTIEGPRFSSRAESKLFRQWNADVVNMSTVPEVVLAKEAGLLYASIALVTDFDSWRDDHEAQRRLRVNVELVLKTFKGNAERACKVLLHAIPKYASMDLEPHILFAQKTAKMSVMGNH